LKIKLEKKGGKKGGSRGSPSAGGSFWS